MKTWLITAFAVGAISVVPKASPKDPACSTQNSWAPSMAFVHLKNAGLTDNAKTDFSKVLVQRIASQRIGRDLYRQVHNVKLPQSDGTSLEVITVNDASTQECSMGAVDVYVVGRKLGGK
jgi:hypothetical protein